MSNPETIEINGSKTILKLCKFAADHGMEGCSFTEIVERLLAELDNARALAPKKPQYFSYSFEDGGMKRHDTLEEAKQATEEHIERYRQDVAQGHHVGDDGDFDDVSFGVILGSADYSVEEVVSEKHHQQDEYLQHEVGTEILNLYLSEPKD